MADSSGRNIIGARRVPSTSLNEDYYTYVRSGGNGGGAPGSGSYHSGSQQQQPQHSLRPAESRFSLREQFSTTRREIEFGFDDASSIFAPSTFASEAGLENDLDETAAVNEPSSSSLMPPPPRPSRYRPPVQRSHYELLCLPNDASLTPNDIRRAFHRAVQNLCVDRQPKRLQLAAASYLGQVQIAFETLIEPYKRAEYGMLLVEGEEFLTFDQDAAAYQASVLEQYMLHGPGGLRTTTDLGMRVDTTSLFTPTGQRPIRNGPGILDLSLRQSITADLPALKEPLEHAATAIRDLAEKNIQSSSASTKRPAYRVHPTLTVTGSTHGLLDESFKLSSVLRDPYRPPGPAIHGARRLDQLLTSRLLPGLNVTSRQELFLRNDSNTAPTVPAHDGVPDSVLEQELEILPFPSVTFRAGHSIKLPEKDKDPLNIEVSVQKSLLNTSSTIPTIGLALDKKIGPGTAFLVVDAGDPDWAWNNIWPISTPRECRELSKFSKTSGGRYLQNIGSKNHSGSTNRTNPFRNAPTLEIGYAFGEHADKMGARAGTNRAFTRPSERGLRGMDDFDVSGVHGGDSARRGGSWTISTGLSSGAAAAYLRYGKDLFTSPSSSVSPKIPRTAPIKKSGLRTEIELGAATPSKSLSSIFTAPGRRGGDILLAFRTLKYIGRFTKIGFEVGLTANNLHLSLYWSRLGQRISIPFLIAATGGSRSTGLLGGKGGKLVFWTTVVPFAAMALWEGFLRRAWSNRKKPKQGKKPEEEGAEKQKKREKLLKLLKGGDKKEKQARAASGGVVDEDASSLVAQQRAEADELTVILATGVENRQKIERQRGGLVILSAKYGVLSGFLKGQQPHPQLQGLGAEDETENEIADVTVALAAIVDEEGRLNLPAGLNKGKLLGFWDPAPSSDGNKTLWVKYLYRGKESVVEVGEGEGLNLP